MCRSDSLSRIMSDTSFSRYDRFLSSNHALFDILLTPKLILIRITEPRSNLGYTVNQGDITFRLSQERLLAGAATAVREGTTFEVDAENINYTSKLIRQLVPTILVSLVFHWNLQSWKLRGCQV